MKLPIPIYPARQSSRNVLRLTGSAIATTAATIAGALGFAWIVCQLDRMI